MTLDHVGDLRCSSDRSGSVSAGGTPRTPSQPCESGIQERKNGNFLEACTSKAFSRGSSLEDYSAIQAPLMRPPPGLPDPVTPRRAEHNHLEGNNIPQPYLGGSPPGYQESPPHRYSREIPRRYHGEGSFSRPLSEDATRPDGTYGPPPKGEFDEAPRGSGGSHKTYRSESESPSPPTGYFRPPPPPPPGGFVDESSRRFGGSPVLLSRYADYDSTPIRNADEAPPTFGGAVSKQPYDTSPPSPGDAEDEPRRFGSTPPRPPECGSRGDSSPPASHGGALPPEYVASPEQFTPQEIPPGRLGAEPQQSGAKAGAGLAGSAGDIAQRQGLAEPPSEPLPSGFGPPPAGLPGYLGLGTLLPEQPEAFPPGAPPPGADPRLPPGTPPPRFPLDVFAARAIASSSLPGLVGYSGAHGAPPPTQNGHRVPLGSTAPRYAGLGGRFEPSEVYGATLPPHATSRRGPHGGPDNSPPIPPFLFFRPQKKQPSGYTASSPPRGPLPRRPGLDHDAIFTADVMPIELDAKLKEVVPHRGNPGSSTGGASNDMWIGMLFLVQIAGVTAMCVIFGLHGLTHTILHYRKRNTFHIDDWLPQLGAAAVIGAVFAILWQHVVRVAPVFMILVTVWTGAALNILVGIVLIATGKTLGLVGIAFFCGGLCQALYAFVVRERIPFAGEMLKKVISVCNAHPSTYCVSYGLLFLSLGWVAIWIFGFSGSGMRPQHALLMAGLVASLVWTMQVFRNIVRVTVAGTVGLSYFQEQNISRTTTPIALLRACTTSLGSICFGSLLVPLVEAPCHLLRLIYSQAGASEFLFSCVVCFLAVYENMIRYFNKSGYIQVALYGKPFLRASKDTWDMLRAQKVDVLVNDDLTGTVLMLACGIGGSLSALVGGIYTFFAHKSLTITVTIVSYLIGSLLTYVTMAVVESAVATYYVCFAEDPDSLQRYDGPFYERMWVRQMELATPVAERGD